MGRLRVRKNVAMGGVFEADLATKFGQLCAVNGVSIKEGLRRLMTSAILENRVPGIDAMDLERRENAKWGAATPTYDGEPLKMPKEAGRKAPAAPSQ